MPYAKKALEQSVQQGSLYDLKEAYSVLGEVYKQLGDHKTALEYYEKYVNLKDSLFNSESTAQMAEMQTKYETGKKDAENKLLQEKNDSNAKTIRQQRYFGIAVAVICVLLIAFALLIFRSNKQKQRINHELERKNHLIEEKQKEILDSIHYAKRIQGSLLASEKYIHRHISRLKST
jgi:tetratricopeptide (TPR) repeat protein